MRFELKEVSICAEKEFELIRITTRCVNLWHRPE